MSQVSGITDAFDDTRTPQESLLSDQDDTRHDRTLDDSRDADIKKYSRVVLSRSYLRFSALLVGKGDQPRRASSVRGASARSRILDTDPRAVNTMSFLSFFPPS